MEALDDGPRDADAVALGLVGDAAGQPGVEQATDGALRTSRMSA